MQLLRPALFISLSVFLISASSGAQPPPQRDPQAVDILEKSFLAMGGPRSQAISDITIMGRTITQRATDQIQGAVTVKLAGRGKSRIDIQTGSETTSYVANGNEVAEVTGGKSQRLPYHTTINKHSSHLPVFSEIADRNDLSYRLFYKGVETINGKSTHHIRIEKEFPGRPPDKAKILGDLSAADLFIDTTSYLLVKRARQVPSVGDAKDTIVVEYYYSDYRAIAGIAVPHLISFYGRGQKISEINITSVAVDTGINALEFEVQK